MIYECDGVDGTLPQIVQSCKPARCVFDGDKAKCKATPCQCNEEDITVSFHPPSFLIRLHFGTSPTSCNFRIFSSMLLTPKLFLVSMQQLCGSDFVKDCGYDDNTIFTCSGEGSTPDFKEKCPKQCVHSMVTHTSRCTGGTCDCPRIGAPKNVSLIALYYILFCGCSSEHF